MGSLAATLLARYGPVLQMDGNRGSPAAHFTRAVRACPDGRKQGVARRALKTRPVRAGLTDGRKRDPLMGSPAAHFTRAVRAGLTDGRKRYPLMGSPAAHFTRAVRAVLTQSPAAHFTRADGPVLQMDGNSGSPACTLVDPARVDGRKRRPPMGSPAATDSRGTGLSYRWTETGGRPPRTLLARYGPVLQMDGNRGSPAAHFTRPVRAGLTDGRKRDPLMGSPGRAVRAGLTDGRRTLYSRGTGRRDPYRYRWTETRPPMGSPAAHFTRAVRAGLTDGRKRDPLWGPPRTLLARYGPARYSRGTGRSYRWAETGGRPPRTLLARYGPVLQMEENATPYAVDRRALYSRGTGRSTPYGETGGRPPRTFTVAMDGNSTGGPVLHGVARRALYWTGRSYR